MTETNEANSYKCSIAREWCERIRKSSESARLAKEQYRSALESIDGLKGVNYDRDTISHSGMEHGDDAVFQTLERLENLKTDALQRQCECMDELMRFEMALVRMDSHKYANILRMRYVELMEWDEIAITVDRTYNHLTSYVHECALVQLYDAMPKNRC